MKNDYDIFLPPDRIKREKQFWSNRLLSDYVADYAAEIPRQIAVAEIHPDSSAVPEHKQTPYILTYSELWNEVRHLAVKLHNLGVCSGDVISLQLPNWTEFVIFDLALTIIGAVINIIAPIYRHKEIHYYLHQSGSKGIVVPTVYRGFDHIKMIEDIRPRCPELEFIWTIGDPNLATSLDPSNAKEGFSSFSNFFDIPAAKPNDVKIILFTAGTTGEPKGVLHSHNTSDYVAKGVTKMLNLTQADIFLYAMSLGHAAGYFQGYTAAMRLGSTLLLLDKWSPTSINETLNTWRCSYTSITTPMLFDIIENGTDEALAHLKCLMVGGAFVSVDVMRRAKERMPHCTLVRGWGQSENSTVTMGTYSDPQEKLLTTDGRLVLEKEIEVRDSITGKPLPHGVEGEIWSRGPSLFLGYHKRPDLTREAMDFNGWFKTGDLGWLDAEGYLTITGRNKDIIIRGGENFPVKEMEDLLCMHPAVKEAAIVPAPDKRLQEKVCAYVSLRDGMHFDLHEMTTYLDSHGIAKRQYPEHLIVLPDLPKTPVGKIMKNTLRIMIAKKVGLPPIKSG